MKMPCGTITFMRTSVNTNGSWGKNINLLTKLEARHEGVIEDDVDMMQVDFANRYIGGGVLSHGSVQEEIRFITCPEMIVACLVCEVMRENESIRIIGAETYSNYVGYGETFKWMRRPKQIETARDEFGRYKCELVAIDAIRYPNPYAQYRFARIKREITKAYSGFSIRTSPNERLTIATGNWGCGVFNGDRQLKSMIQYLAASRAKRNLVYFTFGDKNFANMLNQIVFSLRANHVTIGTLFTWILSYASCDISKSSLFEFIDERIYGNQV